MARISITIPTSKDEFKKLGKEISEDAGKAASAIAKAPRNLVVSVVAGAIKIANGVKDEIHEIGEDIRSKAHAHKEKEVSAE